MAFGQRYLAAVAPFNDAKNAYFHAEDVARSTPCTCPPGQYDYGNLLPAFPAVNRADRAFVAQLQMLQPAVPTVAATDLQALIDALAGEAAATQTLVDLGMSNAAARNQALDQMDASNNAAADASARFRRDVRLPAGTEPPP